jgi:MoaA/NifB/PqqE/SkfB family radical SAM enzyme
MSTSQILRMLDEAQEFGIGVYNAWTAEPLLRADLPKILSHAKSLGLTTSLITNGSLLRKRAKELTDLDLLSVSVDGIKSYKELRGIDLQDVLDGIRAAQQAGHEVLMNCVISGKNAGELEDLVALAESLGCWISFEPMHESPGIDEKVWKTLRIESIPAYEQAIDRLIELKKNGAPIINSVTYLKMVRDLEPQFRCHASEIILHVAADGSIGCCRVHPKPLGNVSQGLENAWQSSQEERRKIVAGCEGCLFFGYVENSLLFDFVPEVMAHYEWI